MVHAMTSGESSTDKQLSEVLRGGKGDMKRNFPVNKELYGTTRGVEEKERTEQELKVKKNKRKIDETKQQKKEKVSSNEASKEKDRSATMSPSASAPQSVVPVAVAVGTVAAFLGYLVGGRRSQ